MIEITLICRVSSDQPVAVFSGNVAASRSGLTRDHVYEQMIPVSMSGELADRL